MFARVDSDSVEISEDGLVDSEWAVSVGPLDNVIDVVIASVSSAVVDTVGLDGLLTVSVVGKSVLISAIDGLSVVDV